MSSNLTAAGIFPAGAAQCVRAHECPVTSDMVSFLNLTNDFRKIYLPSYCLRAPDNDGCPYGFCPNPDIAGPLVRISAYFTNLFVAILIFYLPEELKESFWSQVLTVYSLLITCGISIFQRQLTRIHAIIATATAGSPLSLYIVIYALRSIWSSGHRLAPAVGRGKIIPRIIVLAAGAIWGGLTIYILLPSHLSYFSQASCENSPNYSVSTIKEFFFLPIVIFVKIGVLWGQLLVTLPIQLTVVAWIFAIVRRRKDIWPEGVYSFRFWRVWRTVSDNYPFVQFATVVFNPFAYWVITIEIAVIESNDDYFSATFGQVLATFVAVPPCISVAKLVPRMFRWFADLTWVRFLTRRPRRRRALSGMGIPLILTPSGSGDEHEGRMKKDFLDDGDIGRRGQYHKVELIGQDTQI